MNTLNPETEGELLARRLQWDGHGIAAAFFAALTEANYHYERIRLQEVWDRLAQQQALSQ